MIDEETSKTVIKVLRDFIFENEKGLYSENEDIPEDDIIGDEEEDPPINSKGEDSPGINISSSSSSAAVDNFQEHEPKKSRIPDFVPLVPEMESVNVATSFISRISVEGLLIINGSYNKV